ncbi:MAG TPA: site-2 protease family protein [Phenylobacterium sp.]|uniref:site-2 protease family protein n=1 Tax=Phenylobacterium sp. TaxID=1871053 RepID=UPI002C650DA6|nr:site-2 protease family protein [Phenylobacterium sp.]HXA39268.1 site-2 protease family protein [Phenylobacterium sp.]
MTDTAASPPALAKPNPFVGPAILVVWLALGALVVARPSGLAVFAFVMVGWILSVMAHEFSHAATAWLGGDRTVAEKGYLSFDPRRYGDLGVSLVIPLLALAMGGVGFPGGAVYIRNDLIRSRLWRAAASLAGPAATLAMLLAIAFGLIAWAKAGVSGAGPLALFEALTVLGFLQAMGLILNLLPIPGLDGFGAIRPFLPARLAPHINKAEGLVMIGLLLVIFWVPGASAVLFRAAATLSFTLGLDLDALQGGWAAFHFWRR